MRQDFPETDVPTDQQVRATDNENLSVQQHLLRLQRKGIHILLTLRCRLSSKNCPVNNTARRRKHSSCTAHVAFP